MKTLQVPILMCLSTDRYFSKKARTMSGLPITLSLLGNADSRLSMLIF
jgi:hypothetical protein